MAYTFEKWANSVDANFQPYQNEQGPNRSPPWTTSPDIYDAGWLREPFDVAMSTLNHEARNLNILRPGPRQGSGPLTPSGDFSVNKQVSRISRRVLYTEKI